MAFGFYDRVKETSTTTGTGALTLAGAVSGFRAFSSVFANGDTFYYCACDQNGSAWETGIGTYNSSGTTMSRTTVLASSNAGAAVNFTSGALFVFLTAPAQQFQRGPAFSAQKNADQAISADTLTKVTFQTEDYDTNANFASSTFTPTVAGVYKLTWGFLTSAASVTPQLFSPRIYKNGSGYRVANFYTSGAGGQGDIITCQMVMDGVSDYAEAYIYISDTGRTISANSTNTFFEGCRIA